ncbi:MAG TPA: 2-oxoglutarate dehydrogenase E1 component, partial [Alphaproteobacteria bacterium]|nr:2-oxoglutarate dehydrogenase E1 component [Alphaproteobacteria bacterium]
MALSSDQSSFLFGANATFIADLYKRWLDEPTSVDASWQELFAQLGDDARAIVADSHGASWSPRARLSALVDEVAAPPAPPKADAKGPKPNGAAAPAPAAKPQQEAMSQADIRRATIDSIRALMLIRAYRIRGHLMADLDPLGLAPKATHPELDPATYGFGEGDYDRPIFLNNVLGHETLSLRQILDILRRTYCGRIGVEFMHIQDPEQKQWIQERMEGTRNETEFTEKGKKAIYQRLVAAETFEKFLQVKYTGTKRFGVEGGESLIPAIEQVMKRGAQLGLQEIVLGMAHRGRLNVLAN